LESTNDYYKSKHATTLGRKPTCRLGKQLTGTGKQLKKENELD